MRTPTLGTLGAAGGASRLGLSDACTGQWHVVHCALHLERRSVEGRAIRRAGRAALAAKARLIRVVPGGGPGRDGGGACLQEAPPSFVWCEDQPEGLDAR